MWVVALTWGRGKGVKGGGGGDTKEGIRAKATCPIKATTGELGAWGRKHGTGRRNEDIRERGVGKL